MSNLLVSNFNKINTVHYTSSNSLIDLLKINKHRMLDGDYVLLAEHVNYIEKECELLGINNNLVKKHFFEIFNSQLNIHDLILDISALSWAISKKLNIEELIKKSIPNIFFRYVEEEFTTQIRKIKEEYYKSNDINSLLPSGKNHFCLSFFASLITLDSNKLFKGGYVLSQELLRLHMDEFVSDHAEYLLNCFENLYKNTPPKNCVSKDSIDSSMKKWIFLVLKKPISLFPLKAYEINQAILITLFSDLRQQPFLNNCFAISFLSLMFYFSPRTLFVFLKDRLESGALNIDRKVSIKINSYFIDNNEVVNKTIKEIGIDNILECPCFKSSQALTGVKIVNFSWCPLTLQRFHELFRKNIPFQNCVNFFISYKINPLQQLLVKTFELLNQNSLLINSRKKVVFNVFKDFFQNNLRDESIVTLSKQLLDTIDRNLFLIPKFDSEVCFDKDNTHLRMDQSFVQNAGIINLNDMQTQYDQVIRSVCNFTALWAEDKKINLETSDEIRSYLKTTLQEITTLAQANNYCKINYANAVKEIIKLIDSKIFLDLIKQIVSSLNVFKNVNDFEEYKKLFFGIGGSAESFVQLFNLPFEKHVINEKTPHGLFLKICSILESKKHFFNPPFISHSFPLMAKYPGHAFSLTAHEFLMYWKSEGYSKVNLNHLLVTKDQLINREISKNEILIITKLAFAYDEAAEINFLNGISLEKGLNWYQFITHIKNTISEESLESFELNLWHMYTSIETDRLKSSISELIIHHLGVHLTEFQLKCLFERFEEKFEGNYFFSVLLVSDFIYKFLSEFNLLSMSLGALEDSVCSFFKLPHSIRFADSNYFEAGKEKAHHGKYIIHSNLITLELKIYLRFKYSEWALSKKEADNFKKVELFAPTNHNFYRSMKV